MNKDSEALQSLFAWLLQDSPTNAAAGAKDSSSPGIAANTDEVQDLEFADIDPLDSEEVNLPFPADGASDTVTPNQGGPPLTFGDTPVVQDRFQALLKRRIQTQIERNPPLFPWETDVFEYPDNATQPQVPEGLLWTRQLQNLNLPVPMPEPVLIQLLERCQELLHSSLREGAKLVRAVESLFPGQSQALNQVAGVVMLGPARGNYNNFPPTYESATPAQQMQLSLLAAREIIGTLSLVVSPTQPLVERQWLTGLGMLTLDAEYYPQAEFPKLRVQTQLPAGGRLQMRCGEAISSSQRPDSGCLSLEIFDPLPGQTYSLEVTLDDLPQQPLVLAVCPKL